MGPAFAFAATGVLEATLGSTIGKLVDGQKFHGESTASIFQDTHHQAYDGTPNPNANLIAAIQRAEVEASACAQALIANGFAIDALLPGDTRSLLALTTLTVLEHDGYSLMPL
ncbi:hypothetical protein [Caballeronia insecticola]|uniref:hypothetical protein n=1 Tax=Caballeronia insecticola TaxID=758793 RepID=UPI000688F3DE|nr:hypothetical protein [Caballeronia insecticola]